MNKLFKSASTLLVAAVSLALTSCSDDEPTVLGLNGAAKYGSITVTLSGDRPDGEAFTSTKEYKFMPEEGPQFSQVFTDNGVTYFGVQRMHGAANNNHNDNYAALEMGTDGEDFEAGFGIETSVINKDNTYFYVNEGFSFGTQEVTSYSYNESTGKLRVKFEYVIEDSGSTGSDLTVKVDVNVTVLESIGNNGGMD